MSTLNTQTLLCGSTFMLILVSDRPQHSASFTEIATQTCTFLQYGSCTPIIRILAGKGMSGPILWQTTVATPRLQHIACRGSCTPVARILVLVLKGCVPYGVCEQPD
ncbi:hypothetical protein NEOLEDRAFT_1141507, partial [Neolentinus lepideus HHB14362 ss-1]